MLAIIMAGGRGTRISAIAQDIPKPMIPICGVPVLEREIVCLRNQGFTDIILTVSHMGEVIMDYFKDGSQLGVHISYYFEKEPLGNAGALFRLRQEIEESGDDSFLLLNADAIFDVDFNRMVTFHREKKAEVTLFTHPNAHPYDSGLIIVNRNEQVDKWLAKEDKRPRWYQNRVNAGLHVIANRAIDEYLKLLADDEKMVASDAGVHSDKTAIVPIGKVDLDRQILKPLSGTGKMYVYDSPEYVKDMGTPERYYGVCKDYEKGIVQHPIVSSNHISVFLKNQVPQPWVYYCCGQYVTVPNRFFAMPSWRNRIMGVLMYLHGIKGFLHWGFNFYNSQYSISHIDPFFNTHASYAFPSGDAFLVYPGPDEKPMSSIRAQVQREALDDLNALTTLESVVGRERVVALIMENADEPFDFEHYPHSADYILQLRERMAEIFIQEEQKY